MNMHKGARLTPYSRVLLVERMLDGLRAEEAAQAAGVSVRTAYKWLQRFRKEGPAGLRNRSSRPRRSPQATPEPVVALSYAVNNASPTGRSPSSWIWPSVPWPACSSAKG